MNADATQSLSVFFVVFFAADSKLECCAATSHVVLLKNLFIFVMLSQEISLSTLTPASGIYAHIWGLFMEYKLEGEQQNHALSHISNTRRSIYRLSIHFICVHHQPGLHPFASRQQPVVSNLTPCALYQYLECVHFNYVFGYWTIGSFTCQSSVRVEFIGGGIIPIVHMLYWICSHTNVCFLLLSCLLRAARAWRATTWPTAGQGSSWWWRTATPNTTSTCPATALTASMWCPRAAASRPSTAYHLCTGKHTQHLVPSLFLFLLTYT